jgi:uncharacterized protein
MNPLFIEHLIRPLLDNPDRLTVEIIPGSDKDLVRIYVAGPDVQRVLGRQARVIKSIKACVHLLFPGMFKDIIVDVVA